MSFNQPFSPAYGQTQPVSVSSTAAQIGVDPNAKQIRVLNPNAFVVFVRCSQTGVAAVAAAGATEGDYPIGPNSSEVITKADIWKFRNELYLGNRYQIPVLDNVGGTGFPFQENVGATIQKGVIGPYAKTLTSQGFAFVGGAPGEAPSVWLSVGMGIATKIAAREVEMILGQYTDQQLYTATLEYRAEKEQQFIYLHVPDYTLVYDVAGSQVAQQPLWFLLDSSMDGNGAWRAWHPVYCYGKFLVGDKYDQRIGFIDSTTAAQYGTNARWQFDTIFAYNQAHGFAVSSLELIGTYGRAALGENDTMSLQYTDDGRIWSAPRFISMGAQGRTKQRAQWRPKHFFRNFRGYRFAGYNAAPVSFAALEANGDPMSA
ncbi:packaged DNA stabilization protein [Burkholderia cenocepacia]|uniref:packaged DNA stabilization protein n=1 Tax=Burkholderia cenocepacia TaxID=95486 RepID=UPI002B254909|nr:packaged DNA stabilization protein [Burkholderia cenocepacia]MEB2600061.1 packaged DNA stabilization protein [Burkholderia cenocepacia]